MPDKEKVIKCLELCRKFTNSCEGCPYENVPAIENCMLTMHGDALALLNTQQLDIDALKNTIQGIVEGQCIIAGSKQPQLVRCKECVECYFASNRIQSEQTFACGKHGIDVTPDFFCADGERKFA